MQKTKSQSETKIPILGDIPLLGNLFKKKSRAGSKTELIIFLTPHIVMAPTQLAAVTAVERSKAELVPKAFTEQELNRYIDDLPIKEVSPATNAIPGKANGKLNKPRR